MNKKILLIAIMSIMSIGSLMAQKKVPETALIGMWRMESMQYEGEEKVLTNKDRGYTQVKIYLENGEYACAEVSAGKDGTSKVYPHEYGKYTFRNGQYTEMGRKGNLVLVDTNTFTGRWNNRHDVWKKVANPPKELTDYIMRMCKDAQGTQKTYALINQYLFKSK